jgi:DNA-binding NtrC family response regulator
LSKFIAESISSKNALSSATLAKSLPVNVLIIGENGSGKEPLAKIIVDNIEPLDIKDFEESIESFKNQTLFIKNFSKANNIKQLLEISQKNGLRLIATSSENIDYKAVDEAFPVKIELEPLKNRVEDAKVLAKNIFNEAKSNLTIENEGNLEFKKLNIDYDKDLYQLKRDIYLSILFDSIGENELLSFLEKYIEKELKNGKEYRDLIHLYEIPILKSSKKLYKSQLQMATKLNINRITLRKKLEIYKEKI